MFSDSNYEADLDRAKKEIEQLKTDHEVAMERKDRQVKVYINCHCCCGDVCVLLSLDSPVEDFVGQV